MVNALTLFSAGLALINQAPIVQAMKVAADMSDPSAPQSSKRAADVKKGDVVVHMGAPWVILSVASKQKGRLHGGCDGGAAAHMMHFEGKAFFGENTVKFNHDAAQDIGVPIFSEFLSEPMMDEESMWEENFDVFPQNFQDEALRTFEEGEALCFKFKSWGSFPGQAVYGISLDGEM